MTEKGKPRPGPSVYETLFTDKDKDDKDRTEWHHIGELNPTTGHWLIPPNWDRPYGRHKPL